MCISDTSAHAMHGWKASMVDSSSSRWWKKSANYEYFHATLDFDWNYDNNDDDVDDDVGNAGAFFPAMWNRMVGIRVVYKFMDWRWAGCELSLCNYAKYDRISTSVKCSNTIIINSCQFKL